MRLTLIKNCSMTGNSVEKHCFVVLNVELQVKLKFLNSKRSNDF